MTPLTPRMNLVLLALLRGGATPAAEYGLTGNQIGYALGFQTGSDRYAHDGRMMGPANRVNFSITALTNRGLVSFAPRRDQLSGTAYRLTHQGLQEAGTLDDKNTEKRVLLIDGYDLDPSELNLQPIEPSEAYFKPGDHVTVTDGEYEGQTGIIVTVGEAHGMFYNGVVADVLFDGIEGYENTDRIPQEHLEGEDR